MICNFPDWSGWHQVTVSPGPHPLRRTDSGPTEEERWTAFPPLKPQCVTSSGGTIPAGVCSEERSMPGSSRRGMWQGDSHGAGGAGRRAAKGGSFRTAAEEGQLDASQDRRGQRHSRTPVPLVSSRCTEAGRGKGPADLKARKKPLLTESTGKATRVAVFSKTPDTKSARKNQAYLRTEAMTVEPETEKTRHAHKTVASWLEPVAHCVGNLSTAPKPYVRGPDVAENK